MQLLVAAIVQLYAKNFTGDRKLKMTPYIEWFLRNLISLWALSLCKASVQNADEVKLQRKQLKIKI